MLDENESDDDLPLARVVAKSLPADEQVDPNSNQSFPEVRKEEIHEDKIDEDEEEIPEPVKKIVQGLFEYEWPKHRSGEFYVTEEEFLKYLEIQTLRTDLNRRVVSNEEYDHIIQLGYKRLSDNCELKSIRIEDACQYMAELYPEKFQEYIKTVHNKETRKMVMRQEAQRVDVLKGNIPNIMKRSLKETVRYNSRLNRERKEERCAYFDLQTQIIHLPQKKRKYNPSYKPVKSRYPVAVIPGQFQDYYKKYTAMELKKLPLNTVTVPMFSQQDATVAQQQIAQDTVEDSDDDVSMDAVNAESVERNTEKTMNEKKAKDPFCGICLKGPEMNKQGIPEKLIHCSQCVNSGHPSCLDMNRHLMTVIQGYPWQCMECKICTECLAPHDEEAMMFCDNCDRGYHSYCVGLKEIPKGRWVCEKCGKCSSCLVRNPVPNAGNGKWKNEMSKALDGEEMEFLQIHCHDCSRLFRKGSFCPVCLKVYRAAEDHINPMVCCDKCDRWIHTDCDGIDEQRYNELSKDQKTSYTCSLCLGAKEERMDAFHKKYR